VQKEKTLRIAAVEQRLKEEKDNLELRRLAVKKAPTMKQSSPANPKFENEETSCQVASLHNLRFYLSP
jgi:hypothetical protein